MFRRSARNRMERTKIMEPSFSELGAVNEGVREKDMPEETAAIDYSTLLRSKPIIFQPEIFPIGSTLTLKDGYFIFFDGTKHKASDKAIKLRKEWEKGRARMEKEAATRARKRLTDKEFRSFRITENEKSKAIIKIL